MVRSARLAEMSASRRHRSRRSVRPSGWFRAAAAACSVFLAAPALAAPGALLEVYFGPSETDWLDLQSLQVELDGKPLPVRQPARGADWRRPSEGRDPWSGRREFRALDAPLAARGGPGGNRCVRGGSGGHPRHPLTHPRRVGGGTAGAGSAGGGASAGRARAAARSGRDRTNVGPRL